MSGGFNAEVVRTPREVRANWFEGPLRELGPAVRWCLTAGILEETKPVPSIGDFRAEADVIMREGLAPVALRALSSYSSTPDPLLETFRASTIASQLRAMAVDVAGSELLSVLSDAGIPAVVIKGPAVAQLHPEGWPRPYSDIDIVVLKRDFSRTVTCSIDQGFADSQRWNPQWRWFNVLCREGLNLHKATGGNIDIHHHIPPWSLGSRLKIADIIKRSTESDLCGSVVRVASAEDLMLISALHVLNDLWKGKLGLASWRDMIVIMSSLGRVESANAFAAAGFTWLFEMSAGALNLAVPEAGISCGGEPHGLSLSKRMRVRALGWERDSSLSRHRLSWAMRLPIPNALAFLAGSAFPAPSYIHERHGSLRNYWRAGWEETVSTTRGSDFRMTTLEDKQEKDTRRVHK
jgi:Uncharacterised nucleotidyltransferase